MSQTIQQWAKSQSTEHLTCRDTGYGHPWKPSTVVIQGRNFIETVECTRCGSEKRRTISPTGMVIRQNTRYAEGYVRVGFGRVTKEQNAVVRLESLLRRVA